MANLKAQQVLEMVDSLLPNQYTQSEKLRWLTQAEGFVLREAEGEMALLPNLTENTVLTAPPPYDEMYRHYIEAQIHYCNGEMKRYNNAAALWNNALLTYRDFVCRSRMPQRKAAALKLF